jgi:ribosomal subunit interface protein
MQISVKGHHLEVTESISSYVRERIGRLKQRLQGATHVSVLIAGTPKNGITPSIQIMIHFAGKKVIRIKEYMERTVKDFYTIIVRAFDSLNSNLDRKTGLSAKRRPRDRKRIIRTKHLLA